jgi:Fe(3+) dicitrate transport protein
MLPAAVALAACLAGHGAGRCAEPDEGEDVAAERSATDEHLAALEERVKVVGSPGKADKAPGSVTYLDAETLARQMDSDVHRALRMAPGINVQEEDGYGLRPNIGMRGSGSERSSRITLMEDGVLIAPAPYSAPAAYYFPTVGRMKGIEVRKGSASIRQGPYTTGGALNLVSTSIPASFGGAFHAGGGSDATARGGFHAGDSGERLGWLVETYQMRTDGFKQLDGGGDTGFDLQDYVGKVRLTSRPDAAMFQALELKLGRTEQDGDETYLGLTDEDFAVDPNRRYSASQLDHIVADHEQVQLRYFARPAGAVDVTATVYDNDFSRNWYKLDSVMGTSISTILGDPDTFAAEMDVIRGELAQDSPDDALVVRANRRSYFGRGVQALVGIGLGQATRHDLEVGVRYHEDEEDRFQKDDRYRMTVAGDMVLTTEGLPGSQSNTVSGAEALAFFVQDTIEAGRFTVVPGLRLESIDTSRVDYADPERTQIADTRANSIAAWIPGVGVNYEFTEASSAFFGVHRGFAPPSPSNEEARGEESVNYELGYRFVPRNARVETIGFFNDYDSLLGDCTASTGCVSGDIGDQFNGGEARTWGLELAAGQDFSPGGAVHVPVDLVYTYTRAEFENSFESDFEPWGDVEAGDELPYVPLHQATLAVGVVLDGFSARASLVHVDEMRTVAGQGAIPPGESTDDATLLDLSVSYTLKSELRLFAQGRNVTDEAYVAARQPAGARPGLDRTLLFGLALDF